jgi:hypothetical protein
MSPQKGRTLRRNTSYEVLLAKIGSAVWSVALAKKSKKKKERQKIKILTIQFHHFGG